MTPHLYDVGPLAKAGLRSLAPKGTTLFTSAALNAYVAANPRPTDWRDTRPDYLRDADAHRRASGRLPLWSEGEDTGDSLSGRIQLRLTPDTLATLDALALAFGIGHDTHYVAARKSGAVVEGMRSTRVSTHAQLPSVRRVAYVLRAWGRGYLTPIGVPDLTRSVISPHRTSLARGRRGRPLGSPNVHRF